MTEPTQPKTRNGVATSPLNAPDLLSSCVHCGLCLEVCPTYQQTGDENNSPRGRLRLWRAEAEGTLAPDPWTNEYTAQCVGCLACEPACPANVPYGEILELVRQGHVENGRSKPKLSLRLAAKLARRQPWMNLAMLPARVLRRWGWLRHRLLFAGQPTVLQSSATYAQKLMQKHRPTGPKVALLTGCLMESLLREINFATIRVLIENNIQVIVPHDQGCCGAFQEHLGLSDVSRLRERNRQAFDNLEVDAVLSNSSGCGLALMKSLTNRPVRDVLDFLGELGPVHREREDSAARVHIDLPCHLVHGQRVAGIPSNVLDATGYQWQLAPHARDCCGSGGIYNIQQPASAREILARKADFLKDAEGDPVILATSNHVCMMQWHSAAARDAQNQPVLVRHILQLLDPLTPRKKGEQPL